MNQQDQYQSLVDAFYQAIVNHEQKYIKKAIQLSSNFDENTVEQAKAEASVMSVVDSNFQA